MGGTEFISLHLLQSLLARRPRGRRLQPRPRGPSACPPACATIVGDRKDHAGAARAARPAERFDGVFDVTYAPTLGEDVERAARRARRARRPRDLRLHRPRLRPRAAHPLLARRRRANSTGATTRGTRSPARTCCCERHRERGLPVTIVRPTHVMGPLNTRNNETFFMDRICARAARCWCPAHGGWLRQFGHVEDLADAMAAMLGDPGRLRPGLQRHGRGRGHPGRASSS